MGLSWLPAPFKIEASSPGSPNFLMLPKLIFKAPEIIFAVSLLPQEFFICSLIGFLCSLLLRHIPLLLAP